jgi:zinc resistance-associated protein
MKRVSVLAMAVMIAVLFTSVYGWAQGYGPRYGAAQTQTDVNALRQFQKETLPLRDEMMAKRLEIRNEYSQAKPNLDRIATLQKEMIDLRTKIQVAAEKNGLPAWGPGSAMGRGAGFGPGRGMGPDAGFGRGCGMGGGWRGNAGGGYGPRGMWN